MKMQAACILCNDTNVVILFKDTREYLHCQNCDLVFVPAYQRLKPSEELKRYNFHENNPDDKRYKGFLNKLFEPVNERIKPNSHGLDFGSGPCPVLSFMFEEKGHEMQIYDHYYANESAVFGTQYDFITATEVLEHLFYPNKELDRVWSCLKPNGILGIMTKFSPDLKKFAYWYYKNDDTHVAFYSKKTFEFLKVKWNASLEFIGDNVVIFYK
ncbi:class I SAM-dependent methyltransferase [bacterium]